MRKFSTPILIALAVIIFSFAPSTFAARNKPKNKTASASASTSATAQPASQQSTSGPQQFAPSGNSSIQVIVSPGSAQVTAGSKQQFTASVTGASTTNVLWSVSGAGCLNISCGYITGDGLYVAPTSVPNPPAVTIKATSFADFVTFGSATVTIGASAAPAVTVSPNAAQVSLGAQQQFSAAITGSTSSQVSWSVVDNGCGLNCGFISSTGLYTAPSTLPTPSTITVTARLNIFPPVSGTAQVILQAVNGNGGLTVSPATLRLSARGMQVFTATMNGAVVNFLNWSLSGTGCTAATCGTITAGGFYSAPATVLTPTTVTVTANSVYPPGKSGTATITLQPAVSISVAPPSAVVNTSAQQQFTANVSNASNSAVVWSVSCISINCGSVNGNGLYTAPASVPSPNSVTITATSLADFTQKASSSITISGPGTTKVSVSPSSNLQLNGGASQQFSATVVGQANTAVTWSVGGTGCVAPNCGTITQGGLYIAPSVLAGPITVSIIATSQASPTASASVPVQLVPLVGISLGQSNPQMTSGTQQQFFATVSGTTNTGVQWSIAGANCFVAGSCGTVSASGVYTAPGSVQSPVAITVTATAQADPTKMASAVVIVLPQVGVFVSPTGVKASINTQQQYHAVVTGTANTGLTWTLTGPACSGTACGTITPIDATSALYQAPAAVPSPATVNVVATLASDSTKTGSAGLTIVSSNNSKLNGHYAFMFAGFDGTVSYRAAGTFIADGNGNLINGVEDINCGPGGSGPVCGAAPVKALAFTGTYVLNADGRGTFTLTSSLATSTFAFALAPTVGDARFIESDNSGVRGSGVLEPQTVSDFNNNAFLGAAYATGLSGVDSSGIRVGAVGGMVLPAGLIQAGSLRVNDGGLVSLFPSVGNPGLTGSFNVASNGRGVLTLNAPGLGNGVLNFAMYVVSRNQLFMVSIDPVASNLLLSGEVLQQQLPAFPVYFQPGNAVFSWTALTNGQPDAVVGRMSFDSFHRATVVYSENNAGSISLDASLGGSYRTQGGTPELILTLVYPNPSTNGVPLSVDHYLYPFGLNSAFILGSTDSVRFGKIETQTIAIPQNFAFGTDSMIVPDSRVVSGTGMMNLPQVSGNEDLSDPSGFSANLALSGTWPLTGGAGTFSIMLPEQQSLSYWIVSYTKIVALDTDPTVVNPTLTILEQ